VAVDRSRALAGVTLTRVDAGHWHTCALDTSGHAFCWGRNKWGELGTGAADRTKRLRPVAVERHHALAGVTLEQISAGGEHTCALDTSGRAYCWGLNDFGQLGTGDTRRRTEPVPVKPPLR
jgi:alpha-tubulin suppressor-like RCC1 family protein